MQHIESFLANNTKGLDARKELFDTISNELYSIFYENKKVDFDVDLVFEEWINQVGFLGESFNCLRVLFYIVNNQERFLNYHYKIVKGCFNVDNEEWSQYFDKLTAEEVLILHKMINN